MSPSTELETVYVFLPNEAVDTWRPVRARRVGPFFRLTGPVPDGERWEFPPDELVRCETRTLSDGPCLVAVAPA